MKVVSEEAVTRTATHHSDAASITRVKVASGPAASPLPCYEKG